MKRRYVFFSLLLSLVFLPTIYNIIYYHYDPYNALCRFFLSPYEGTEWTSGFSDWNFSKVHVGMKEKEVLLLLGEPLGKVPYDSHILWSYSIGKTISSDHDRRRIYFTHNGTVQKTLREFYVD